VREEPLEGAIATLDGYEAGIRWRHPRQAYSASGLLLGETAVYNRDVAEPITKVLVIFAEMVK